MEALSTIETMKANIEALNWPIEAGGFAIYNKEREAMVEAVKPPMFKGAHDAQEHDKYNKGTDKETRRSHNKDGEDHGKNKEKQPYPKNHDINGDGKMFGCQNYTKRKVHIMKKNASHICGVLHGYAR
ncbi:hypothetical protein T459_04668 [Capsicum annuum]|uniref:Uncharacterized protein n=1 Tax=Capsicum annuum TaxID=4072 RepID=A0A2G3A5N7_CAPAN|nr:hypothetical protein T459_04668 [Capsicum annuum]